MSPNKLSLLMWLLFTAATAGGEPRYVTAQPGLVELRLEATASSDITWEAREPVTIDYRLYEAKTVLVTYLASGRAIIISDVIDWELKKRDKTTWIITVGDAPTPPAPGPPPGPAPTPVPPLPAVAAEVYRMARAINQPEAAIRYGMAFRTVSSEIGAGSLTSALQVQQRIREVCRGIAPGTDSWKAVGSVIAERLKPLQSVQEIRGVLEEVALGLEAAGGPQ